MEREIVNLYQVSIPAIIDIDVEAGSMEEAEAMAYECINSSRLAKEYEELNCIEGTYLAGKLYLPTHQVITLKEVASDIYESID